MSAGSPLSMGGRGAPTLLMRRSPHGNGDAAGLLSQAPVVIAWCGVVPGRDHVGDARSQPEPTTVPSSLSNSAKTV